MLFPSFADGSNGGNGTSDITTLLVAVGSLFMTLGTAIGGAIIWVLNWRKNTRKDALTEWQAITNRQQSEIDQLRKDLATSQLEISRLRKELMEARVTEAKSEGQIAQLQGLVNLLNTNLRRLQERMGDTPPGVTLPCEIIADDRGTIRFASASVGSMFNWLPAEIVGKNITVLMAPEYVDAHKQAMENLIRNNRTPNPEKTIIGTGITKNGEHVPVMINLSGWSGPTGQRYINAEIRRRTADSTADIVIPMAPDIKKKAEDSPLPESPVTPNPDPQ